MPRRYQKLFTPNEVPNLQAIHGKFVYPAQTVDNTKLLALNKLSVAATLGNGDTIEALNQFLNYFATNPYDKIFYQCSDMILCVDSDAA